MKKNKIDNEKVNEVLENAKILAELEQEKKIEGERFDTNNIDDNLDLRDALENKGKPCLFKKIISFFKGL